MMPTCRTVARIVSQAQDSKLPLATRLSLRLHLLLCRGCRNFERNVAELRESMRRYTR